MPMKHFRNRGKINVNVCYHCRTIHRLEYEKKIKLMAKRYREVEKRQTDLKQKLVEFNNFVKEKEIKIIQGQRQIKQEKRLQLEKGAFLTILLQESEVHHRSFDVLEACIEKKKIFAKYLQKVVEKNPELFSDITELLHKNVALFDIKERLQHKIKGLRNELICVEKGIETFKENKMKDTLVFSIKLGPHKFSFLVIIELTTDYH